jgi:hypothetical protein
MWHPKGVASIVSCLQAGPHLETLAPCAEASTACCDMLAAAGGTAALLRLLQSATGRDRSCQDALHSTLLCLAHLCRHPGRAEEVFKQEGLLMLLAKLLADNRDKEVRCCPWYRTSLFMFMLPAGSLLMAYLASYCPLVSADCSH